MSQRTALEQDVIDYVNSVIEIYDRQLELQKIISDLLREILLKVSGEDLEFQGFEENSFGVNDKACSLTRGNLDPKYRSPLQARGLKFDI